MAHYHNTITTTTIDSINVVQHYCTTCGASRFEKDGKELSFEEVRALDPSQWDDAAVKFHRTHKPLEKCIDELPYTSEEAHADFPAYFRSLEK